LQEPPKNKKGLRHGYTTGACATAAAKAATLALFSQEPVRTVEIRLPKGQHVSFPIEDMTFNSLRARCAVIKDGGDDPDATHGAFIYADVEWSGKPGLQLEGGPGVGRVTKPGLVVPVGMPAINPVPQRMIREAVSEVVSKAAGEDFFDTRGLRVTISVPNGEEIAKKTMNARIGILGGISILGTTGIVKPFSTAAYMASVAQSIDVAKAAGQDHLVLTTGGRSETAAMREFPGLPEEAFIQMGDFAGFALKNCARRKIGAVTLVGMMGKFSKLAEGHMNLHAHGSKVNMDFLASVAKMAGAPDHLLPLIREANTAKQVGDLMMEHQVQKFFTVLCERICEQCFAHAGGRFSVETILIDLDGNVLGRAHISPFSAPCPSLRSPDSGSPCH
jgi:cobalt-precorrin-5B (C1)-methyltransferase